jgi:hypothetical protein
LPKKARVVVNTLLIAINVGQCEDSVDVVSGDRVSDLSDSLAISVGNKVHYNVNRTTKLRWDLE